MKCAVLALTLVFAASATADPARVVTGAPQVLAPAAVNGTGMIYDGGQAGTWYFEYSSPWFNSVTPVQEIAGSAGDQQVSLRLDNVAAADTTYRYRLVLQTPDGVAYGDWVEFTTPTAPILKSRPPAPRLEFSSRRLRVARDNTIGLLLGCRAGATPCRGTIAIKDSDLAGARTLTRSGRFTIPAGHWARVRVRLTRAGQRLIGDGLLAFVEIHVKDDTSYTTGTSRQLTRRARR